MTTNCTCQLWADTIKKINASIDIARIHGLDYNGEPFRFCPWCGRDLNKDEMSIAKCKRDKDDQRRVDWVVEIGNFCASMWSVEGMDVQGEAGLFDGSEDPDYAYDSYIELIYCNGSVEEVRAKILEKIDHTLADLDALKIAVKAFPSSPMELKAQMEKAE